MKCDLQVPMNEMISDREEKGLWFIQSHKGQWTAMGEWGLANLENYKSTTIKFTHLQC